MEFHIPVTLGMFRIGLVVVGGGLVALAWLTADEMWSKWYWVERVRGNPGDVDIHESQLAGLKRAKYLLMGVGMVALGISFPWLLNWLVPGAIPTK